LLRCIKESELGLSIDKIFTDFADRTGLLSARRLTVAIIQARKGLDVTEALSEAIDDAREKRRQTIVAQAEMAEKKASIPLMMMLLPAIILTIAPMLITLVQSGGIF
jgi:Flp pilus assembly protein TadB